MYYGIHYLRGIAALMVVMHHCANYLPENIRSTVFGGAASGVDIFFMISGFIIVIATQNKESNSAFSFFSRRFFRIYPALIFCIVAGYFTIYSDKSLSDIGRAIIPLPIDYSMNAPAFGYNLMGPAWTLTYEIMFYAIFGIAMSISHKHRVLIATLIMSMQCILIQAHFNGSFSLSAYTQLQLPDASALNSYLKQASSPMFFEFILGMLLAELFVRYGHLPNKHIGASCLIAGSAAYIWLYASQSTPGFGPTYFGMWSALLVSGICIYQASNRIATIRPLIFLGNISYSIYISHYVVMGAAEKYNILNFHEMTETGKFLSLVTACAIIGTIIHHAIEKPFIKVGKTITDSSARPIPQARAEG